MKKIQMDRTTVRKEGRVKIESRVYGNSLFLFVGVAQQIAGCPTEIQTGDLSCDRQAR
jgi:hypothetical protein